MSTAAQKDGETMKLEIWSEDSTDSRDCSLCRTRSEAGSPGGPRLALAGTGGWVCDQCAFDLDRATALQFWMVAYRPTR